MDHLGLIVLKADALADCEIIANAARLAGERLGYESPAGLEGCAFQRARLYNAAEQLGMRIAKAFENNIDDERGWHMELLRRLSLTIPGIRPAFLDTTLLGDLNELRSFRHVVRHASTSSFKKRNWSLCSKQPRASRCGCQRSATVSWRAWLTITAGTEEQLCRDC